MMTCPHCGLPLDPNYSVSYSHQYESSLPWRSQVTSSAPNFTEATRRTPTGRPSLAGDVAVPFLQALITALVVAIVAIPLTIAFGKPWWLPLVIASVVLLVVWWVLLWGGRELLWTTETIINENVPASAQRALPAPRVEVAVNQERHTELDDLPGPLPLLQKFAQGVTDDRWTFSERGAARSGYGATAFKELRDIFLQRGWATWNVPGSPQQGVNLNGKGRAISRGIAGPPSPAQDGS